MYATFTINFVDGDFSKLLKLVLTVLRNYSDYFTWTWYNTTVADNFVTFVLKHRGYSLEAPHWTVIAEALDDVGLRVHFDHVLCIEKMS